MSSASDDRVLRLLEALEGMTEGQRALIERIVVQFRKPHAFARKQDTDLVSGRILRDFGDALRLHHCFSAEAFTKDKFEYALERVCNACSLQAERAPRGNPGHDITIGGTRFSLKTQADNGIKGDLLHISKFMELGKGRWTDRDDDLVGLREQFFGHMRGYDRILSLRRLPRSGNRWRYELVEIPKALLMEARGGRLRMAHESRQFPKPGFCHVGDAWGGQKFHLYLDGGTEWKLQIRQLRKSLCVVHAEWAFEVDDVDRS